MVIREQGGLPPIFPLLFSVTGLRGWLRPSVRPSVRPSSPSGCPFASRPLPFQVRRERRSRVLRFRAPAISLIARLAIIAVAAPPRGGGEGEGSSNDPLISNEIVRERAMARTSGPAEIFIGLTVKYSTGLMLPALLSVHALILERADEVKANALKVSRVSPLSGLNGATARKALCPSSLIRSKFIFAAECLPADDASVCSSLRAAR